MNTNFNSGVNEQTAKDEAKVREILGGMISEYKKNKVEVPEPEVNQLNGGEYCCLIFFNFIFFLCIYPICVGFFTVEPLQAVVLMFMGKVIKVVKKPGLNWYFPIGRTHQIVSLGKIFFDINYFDCSLI